jgi:hypothetical protein
MFLRSNEQDVVLVLAELRTIREAQDIDEDLVGVRLWSDASFGVSDEGPQDERTGDS